MAEVKVYKQKIALRLEAIFATWAYCMINQVYLYGAFFKIASNVTKLDLIALNATLAY